MIKDNVFWSYMILGNDFGTQIYGTFHDIIISSFTSEELNNLSKTFSNNNRIKMCIKEFYNVLISYAFTTETRIGFQALGVFLMEYGGKMTDNLKKVILKYSKWKDERSQLTNRKDKVERKKYLFEFREKILKYNSSDKVLIPDISVRKVKNNKRINNDSSSIFRKNIDYSISNIDLDIKEYFNLSSMKFKVNDLITLKLEGGKTFIYINNRRFIICKYAIINVPKSLNYDTGSIDGLMEISYQNKNYIPYIPLDVEFWVHCSNLQVWAENDYNSNLLHSNLSFPLLKKLVDVGDLKAKKVFAKEIIKRFESGHISVIEYLNNNNYLKYLNIAQKNYLLKILDELIKINYKNDKNSQQLKEIKMEI
ncbi:MAG: hypothetical protein ACFFDF_18950, partial [Candidatus Odinarchaeota archaeon]